MLAQFPAEAESAGGDRWHCSRIGIPRTGLLAISLLVRLHSISRSDPVAAFVIRGGSSAVRLSYALIRCNNEFADSIKDTSKQANA
jgi:hypothetical protein